MLAPTTIRIFGLLSGNEIFDQTVTIQIQMIDGFHGNRFWLAHHGVSMLRGFNVIPSWGTRIEQAWLDYRPDAFRKEAAPAISTHANCIQLWIEFTSWMADPDRIQASFMDAEADSSARDPLAQPS